MRLPRVWPYCTGAAPREVELFHGTSTTPPHVIYGGQEGFDMRRCTAVWGVASYFAEQAAYSNAKYVFVNDDGEREILVADVLVGKTVEVDPREPAAAKLRMPPELPGEPGVHADSVTGVGGGGGQSRVFMIYANGRAYPKYKLTYRMPGDRPKSPTPKPTDPKAPKPAAAAAVPVGIAAAAPPAAAVDTFAIYLRPSLPQGGAGA